MILTIMYIVINIIYILLNGVNSSIRMRYLFFENEPFL